MCFTKHLRKHFKAFPYLNLLINFTPSLSCIDPLSKCYFLELSVCTKRKSSNYQVARLSI